MHKKLTTFHFHFHSTERFIYVLCFGYDSYYGYSIGPASFGREPLAASYDVKWLSDVI